MLEMGNSIINIKLFCLLWFNLFQIIDTDAYSMYFLIPAMIGS